MNFLEFLFFMFLPGIAFIFSLIGYFGRCKKCRSWKFAFDHKFEADTEKELGYKVCKLCGNRVSLGNVVNSDGVWAAGYGDLSDSGGGDCGGGGDGGG
jgi:hypothetical protein